MTEKEFILEFAKRYQEYQKRAAAINTFDREGRMEHEGLKIDLLLFCIEHEETILEVDGRSVVVGFEIADILARFLREQLNGIVEIIARSWQLLIED
jgi:hypothetical protein